MGYRMYATTDKGVCYGKLYGYCERKDLKKMESYKFLLDGGYITGKEKFDYDGDHFFVIGPEDFRKFRDLYDKDACALWGFKKVRHTLKQWLQYHNDEWKIIYWG